MTPPAKPAAEEPGPVDGVLLIDGDNDPHVPPHFNVTSNTLVRVFLRPDGKLPAALQRRFAATPMFCTVASTKGGANAADFVMSLHVGILHATLPLHLPFTIVTHDASLSVVVQELQRVGRQASLWTSHPERGGAGRRAASGEAKPASPSRRGRGRGRGRASSRRSVAAAPPAPEAASIAVSDGSAAAPAQSNGSVAAPGGRSLAEVAAAYASRLRRIKDPPSRLKTLINDIANRAGASGYTPQLILDELKLSHGVSVDGSGRVTLAAAPPKAA